jgi:very-short-patch-repair endonuclease
MIKSELYAIRDGIKIEEGKARGGLTVNIYCIPCEKCGGIIKKQVYNGEKIYLCEYCKKQIVNKKKALEKSLLDDVVTKKEQAFKKAVERIKLQVNNFSDYEKAISLAKRRTEFYGSIPEAMVAIELVRLGHQVIPQQKIGRYKVDFVLKDKKMVIEVDGGLYHKNIHNDDREAVIQLSLGFDWKIIHVPAELIAKDIQKLKIVIDKSCNTGAKK